MQNRDRNTIRLIVAGLLALSFSHAVIAEIFTLFTTPAERQIINNNRYNREEVKQVSNTEEPEEVVVEKKMKEHKVTYKISGITLAEGGDHTVWIDGKAFRNGERLTDGSKIKVHGGQDIRVQITAPNGKQFFATSGQKLDVVYLVPTSE